MRDFVRSFANFWISRFGSPIRDEETNELLGRAIILVWRGKIHLLGLTSRAPITPVFRKQDRVRYWRQSVGFTRTPEPDFPRSSKD